MTKRKRLTAAQRVRIFDAADGVCHLCKQRIHAERGELWDVEHIKPLWNGGKDKPSNMAPAHKDCHAPKTAEEAGVRAKGNAQRARHIGAVRPKGTIRSAGFAKKQRPEKLPIPPRRSIYEDVKQ